MPLLRSLINVAAIFAIAQALVKILEMALDSKQTQDFQHATERLALKLIDLDPIRHYQRLGDRRVQLRWYVSVLVLAFIENCAMALKHGPSAIWGEAEISFWWFPPGFLLYALVFYFPFCFVLRWFGRSTNTGILLAKLVFFGIIFTSYKMVYAYIPKSERELIPWEVALFGLLFCVLVSFYAAAVVVVLYSAQAVVWLFRQVLWRIATDVKGAWSASLFIAASLLGLAAVFIPKS